SRLFQSKIPDPQGVMVTLTQEKRTLWTPAPAHLSKHLSPTEPMQWQLPPVPGNGVLKQRQITLEVREGSRVVRPNGPVPQNVDIPLKTRRWRLNAVQQGDQVRLDLPPGRPGSAPTAN